MIESGTPVIFNKTGKKGIYWDKSPFDNGAVIYNDGTCEEFVDSNDLTVIRLNIGDKVHTINDLHRIVIKGHTICGGYLYQSWQKYENKDAIIEDICYNSNDRVSYSLNIDNKGHFWCSLFFDILDNNKNNTSINDSILDDIYDCLGN